eukprot:Skav234456  [mRNA]  locus=scaffold1647:148248:152376:+ [translate_table: standard]
MALETSTRPRTDGKCQKVLLVLACFTGQLVVMGLYYSYGQLFAALKNETGESGGKLAFIGSTRDFLLNSMMALGGYCVKGIGYVKLAAFASGLVILGLLLDSIVPSTSWLFLSFSIISGTGCGLLFITSSVVLYSRFSGNMLPVAVGLAAAGAGAGTIVFNAVLAPLTEAWGWRHARQFLAAGLLVLLTMNTLILRYCLQNSERVTEAEEEAFGTTDSEPSELERSDAEKSEISVSLRSWRSLVQPFGIPSFGLLSVGLVLYMGGFTVPYTHIVYYAQRRHYEKAAMLVSILGVGSLFARIACGICAVAVSPRLLFLLVILIQALALAWLPTCDTAAELITFSVLFGGSSGARVVVLPLVLRELFGAENVPRLFGLSGLAIGFGALIGPTLVGGIFDLTGNYRAAFWTSSGLVLASLPCFLASYWHAQRDVKEADALAV